MLQSNTTSIVAVFISIYLRGTADGSGYVEDGREIFDDEDNEDHENAATKRDKSDKKRAKKRLRDVNKPTEGSASILSMFGNATIKKKDVVKLDDDEILAGLLGEIDPNESTASGSATTASVAGTSGRPSKTSSLSDSKLKEKTEMALVKDYIASISKVVPTRKSTVKSEIDDEVRQIYLNIFLSEFLFSQNFYQ